MEENLLMRLPQQVDVKKAKNTLMLMPHRCSGCGRCVEVCPHGVFAIQERKARMVNANDCMECGACQLNCPAGAITIDSGVGCAGSTIRAAFRGEKLDSANCTCE